MAYELKRSEPDASLTKRGWPAWSVWLFLLICLVIGLAIAELYAPQPVIGTVRFADIIWDDSAARLMQVIEAARQDSSIAGVVLEISSPGGLATSSEQLFYTLLELRKVKPLVVVIDDIAASGGYYMAVAANRIYASPSSYVGNVGVRGPRPFDPLIYSDELSTGPYKVSGGDRFDQIRQLDLLKEAFVGNVVNERQQAAMNPLKVDTKTVEEARIYVGSEALGIGFIDAEGSLSDGIQGAAELAGLTDYQSQDLLTHFGFPFTLQPQPDAPFANFAERVAERMLHVPKDTAYFLDSRIPLSPAIERTALQKHLLQLRATAPLPWHFSQEQSVLEQLFANGKK